MFPKETPDSTMAVPDFKEILGSLSLTDNGQKQLLSPQVGKIPQQSAQMCSRGRSMRGGSEVTENSRQGDDFQDKRLGLMKNRFSAPGPGPWNCLPRDLVLLVLSFFRGSTRIKDSSWESNNIINKNQRQSICK